MENTVEFYKYHGTGNDFVMIDNRSLQFPKNEDLIAHLCDRRFGIGGDGLILLENDEDPANFDFRMVYYNADGRESTMCGNGGRCIVSFAHFLDIFDGTCRFNAVDGAHEAVVNGSVIKLKMIDVQAPAKDGNDFVLDTGSPHYVRYVNALNDLDVFSEGRQVRNSENYRTEGINVNFVEPVGNNSLFVRTYERGVEDETYSCGTGATAAALTWIKDHPAESVEIRVKGGVLRVYAERNGNHFSNVWLEGPATQVFRGKISI